MNGTPLSKPRGLLKAFTPPARSTSASHGQEHAPSSNELRRSVSDRPELSRLSGRAPLQAPHSARRENDGEGRGDAERDERPNPEEHSAGIGDPAADESRSPHVEDEDTQPTDRAEEHDDVPRPPGLPARRYQESIPGHSLYNIRSRLQTPHSLSVSITGESDEELKAALWTNDAGETGFEASAIQVRGDGGMPVAFPEFVSSLESPLKGFPQALESLEVGLEELIEGGGAGIAGPVSGRAGEGLRRWAGGSGDSAHAGARRNPSSRPTRKEGTGELLRAARVRWRLSGI